MKRAAIAVFLVISSSAWLLAQGSAKGGKATGQAANVEDEIRKLEQQLREAAVKADTTVLERLLTDDYTNTNGVGLVRSKAQIIEDARSGASKNESITLEDVKVRMYGDAAVLTAIRTTKSSLRGKDTSGRFRSLRVYVKRQGRWQAAALQLTRIAD